jgi:hypothetical protein
MSQTSEELRKDWAQTKEILKTMRDEIRVRMHLAGMEAKQRFSQLDVEADKLSRDIEKTTRTAVEELVAKLRELRDSLEKRS